MQTTDDVKQIDMTFIKDMGWLSGWTRQRISWSCRGEPSGNIIVEVSTDELRESPHILFDYKIRKRGETEWKSIKYSTSIESTSCNYGGKRWWFKCPNSTCNKRIRILYESGDYFVCRKCAGLWYESQKYLNSNYKWLDRIFKAEDFAFTIKRFYYNGKPTRQYQRYLKMVK